MSFSYLCCRTVLGNLARRFFNNRSVLKTGSGRMKKRFDDYKVGNIFSDLIVMQATENS